MEGETETHIFLSFRLSTMPGITWRMYVHVQIRRRMTRRSALKLKRAVWFGN